MSLHPQSEAFLNAIAEQKGPGWDEMSPSEARDVFRSLNDLYGSGPDLAEVSDQTLFGEIPVRLYASSVRHDAPCVIYFHGGGWVLGDLETHEAVCRRLCAAADVKVISVDYRRPPESPYPAAIDDCFKVTKHVSENAAQLGVDPHNLFVAGDSAGGNLAAGVSLIARDDGGPALAGQLLVYPVIDTHFDSESYTQFGDEYGLTRTTMRYFWQQYLATNERGPSTKYATLNVNESLSGLPHTLVLLAEFDVLRSEGEAFAQRLAADGVKTTIERYDGLLHGFVHFAAAFDASHQAIADMASFIQSIVRR